MAALAVGVGVGVGGGGGLFRVEEGEVVLAVEFGNCLVDLYRLIEAVCPLALQLLNLFPYHLQLRLLQPQYLPRLLTVLFSNVPVFDEEVVLLYALFHHFDGCTSYLLLPLSQSFLRLLSQQSQLAIVLHHK